MNYYGELEQEGLFIASLRYFYTKSTQIHDGSTSLQMNTNCQARAIIRYVFSSIYKSLLREQYDVIKNKQNKNNI